MGMDVGGGGGSVRSDINITPLVDVVLVLLIIFMVVTPLLQMGYETDVPPKPPEDQPIQNQPPPPDQIVVRIDRDGHYWINKEQISAQDFSFRLSQATQGRSTKPVFFAGDADVEYYKVSEFLDLCYNNGAANLSIVLDDLDESGAASAAPK